MNGELGVGDNLDRVGVATAVTFTDDRVATSVVVGGEYTCASVSDGSLWCWGGNDYGQLGVGTTVNALSPVLVPNMTLTFLPPPPPWISSSPGPADDASPVDTSGNSPSTPSSVAEPPPPPRVLVADDESAARASTRRGGVTGSFIFAAVVAAAASMMTPRA